MERALRTLSALIEPTRDPSSYRDLTARAPSALTQKILCAAIITLGLIAPILPRFPNSRAPSRLDSANWRA